MPSEPLQIEFSTAERRPKWVVAKSGASDSTDLGVVHTDSRWSTFSVVNSELKQLKIASPLDDNLLLPMLIENEPGELSLAVNAVADPLDVVLATALSKFENVPDGSTVRKGDSLLYSYSGPTNRYPHRALGDNIEWSELVVASTDPATADVRFTLSSNEVFEGLYPLVADLNGDGIDEIVTTVSNPDAGARLIAFGYHDQRRLQIVAESDSIGARFRWMHQIAVAPFGPNGETEIAAVRTPHIGGIAQFFRLNGERLELVASKAGGYMSHVNGSLNLDQAMAGDFDGDGAVELLVPSADQTALIALRRMGDSVEEVWKLDLGSRLATNLAVVELENGRLVLGAATEDGLLHIWK
ncbi:MAG: hypothetical protein HQ477_02205 [Chloroflexi bacterium]|nr:hypothetical protein [Chloroflexota bacterium]